ncbi:NUDIX hydrolase [Streptomyces sp. NPDC057877]|uniref:NUDIX hydrolase n=1 Tax=Streptomyces sp. NPDC057877 TaxID=3346269 RepID=UPI00369D1B7B
MTEATPEPPTTSEPPIQAAGCVLWRHSPLHPAELEICLVHRPKYDDWSHPKGKLKPHEPHLPAALREVAEETGYDATPGPELATHHYLAEGRPKQVRYWAAEARTGTFTPNDEVDRILWLPLPEARTRLTQPRDRTLLDDLLEAMNPSDTP